MCGVPFDISNQIRDGNVGGDAHKDMNVIGHRIDLNQFLLFVGDDASYVFVEFGFVSFGNKGLSSFDGKDDVYVELCVGVCHLYFSIKLCYGYCAPLEREG